MTILQLKVMRALYQYKHLDSGVPLPNFYGQLGVSEPQVIDQAIQSLTKSGLVQITDPHSQSAKLTEKGIRFWENSDDLMLAIWNEMLSIKESLFNIEAIVESIKNKL